MCVTVCVSSVPLELYVKVIHFLGVSSCTECVVKPLVKLYPMGFVVSNCHGACACVFWVETFSGVLVQHHFFATVRHVWILRLRVHNNGWIKVTKSAAIPHTIAIFWMLCMHPTHSTEDANSCLWYSRTYACVWLSGTWCRIIWIIFRGLFHVCMRLQKRRGRLPAIRFGAPNHKIFAIITSSMNAINNKVVRMSPLRWADRRLWTVSVEWL